MFFYACAHDPVLLLWQELARRLAEHEKKEYRRNREREKERERLGSEKMAMEKRRHEGNYRVTCP